MSIDAIMVVDGKWIFAEDEEGKWTGAKGFIKNPIWDFPQDDGPEDRPIEYDFIKQTPKLLESILDNLNIYCLLKEPREVLFDTKFDERGAIESIGIVKSLLVNLYGEETEHYGIHQDMQLLDFFKLGCELQFAGKRPHVLIV
ncbi:MAG TPA: hypothetical protein VK436_10830 [Methanocella sp.]|nr:hypothetical protein [Methanocella sp.]